MQTDQALLNLLERPPMIPLSIFDEKKDDRQKTANETNHLLNVMNQMFKYTGAVGMGK